MSVAAIAGVASPLFFGWVYSRRCSRLHSNRFRACQFLIAALILAAGGAFGWVVARRAAEADTAAPAE